MRIGQGFDVHAFARGRKLILGGVEIPHELGLDGHSDADVLTHAVMDAILGALGLSDIGEHFPDSNLQYKDICSLTLLQTVCTLMRQKGFEIENVDTTLIIETPRIAPHKTKIKQMLAQALNIDANRVNIKATTTEKLGFIGRGEGIAVNAVVLLREI